MAESYIEMYLKELSEITPCDVAENTRLLKNLRGGDDEAKARLIEGNLHLVLTEAIPLETCGLPIEDIISEGNLALVSAVDEVESSAIVQDGETFAKHLSNKIHEGMMNFIDEEGAVKLSEAKLEEEVNRLMLLTKNFEEENNRPATLEELAKLSGLTIEETEELVRISYSAMQMGDNSEGGNKEPGINPDPGFEPGPGINPDLDFEPGPGKNPLKDGWNM